MSAEPGKFTLMFASPNQLGKATEAAMELAKRARRFTSIEIVVVPTPDLKKLREERDSLQRQLDVAESFHKVAVAERDAARAEAHRLRVNAHHNPRQQGAEDEREG